MPQTPTHSAGGATVLPFAPVRREPWLSKRQAAEHLGVSTRTIERRQADGGLPFHVVHGLCRYRASELDSWIESEPPTVASAARDPLVHRLPTAPTRRGPAA